MDHVLDMSRKVLGECMLRNGAIVAADTDHTSYPCDAKAYRFVWPRDAAFVLEAADILGLGEVHERFYRWCLERAYGVREEGLFHENYHTNGSPNKQTGCRQLDQTGAVLWGMGNHYGGETPDSECGMRLVESLGEGLYKVWDGECLSIPHADIWEEQIAYPELRQQHSYTLAACSCGLRYAGKSTGNKDWVKASKQMGKVLRGCEKIVRTTGLLVDSRLDASLLGLCWPYGVLDGRDERVKSLTEAIEEDLVVDGWAHRYINDRYDGWSPGYDTRYGGAGGWPLINLWLSIAYHDIGGGKSALEHFEFVRENCEDYLPEQVFLNEMQKSPKPLAWAHAMYVIAADKLGLL